MVSFNKLIACIGCVLALGYVPRAMAQEERVVTLTQRLRLGSEAQRAYVVVSDSKRVTAIAPATYIEAPAGKEGVVVARVPLESTLLQVLFIMIGVQGEVQSAYRELGADELSPSVFLGTASLRDRFVERRGVLRQLQSSSAALDAKLQALQADADAIANVQKLVSAEDELQEVRRSLQRVKAAQDVIQHRVSYLRTLPPPSNAQRREVELVQQVGEISTALSKAETVAVKKISAATGELQSKLRDIEDTKEEHVGLLEQELLEAQRARRPVAVDQ